MMPDVHFDKPEWLAYGVAFVVLVGLLAAYAALRRRRALAAFAGQQGAAQLTLSVSRARRALKLLLVCLGGGLLFVAMARPRFGFHYEEQKRMGVDLVFAIDTSRSMLASDLTPDRLTRAKLAVSDLVRQFEGDRAGLVAFAGSAFLEVPMTTDRDAFERALAALDTDVIARGGTNLTAALREASAAFGDAGHDKIVVLLTDGENLDGDAEKAAAEVAKAGVRVFTVGVGTPEGSLIEVAGQGGKKALLRDAAGEPVKSALDEQTLRAIAERTHGAYAALGASGKGLTRLYERHLAHLPKHAVAARKRKVYEERFMLPLALGLVLLLLEPLIGERRRGGARSAERAKGRRPKSRKRAQLATALSVLGLACVARPASAKDVESGRAQHEAAPLLDYLKGHPERRAADAAYAAKDYARARALWSQGPQANAPEQRYNVGVSAYREGQLDAAIAAFDAALRGGAPELQQKAYYDRGNAQFRRADAVLAGNRAQAKADFQKAAASYEAALALDAKDEDARANLALVKRRLKALEEEPPPAAQNAQNDPQRGDTSNGAQNAQNQAGAGQQSGPSGGDKQSASATGKGQSEDGKGQPQQTGKDESQQAGNGESRKAQGQSEQQTGQGQPKTAQNGAGEGRDPDDGQGGEGQDDKATGEGRARAKDGAGHQGAQAQAAPQAKQGAGEGPQAGDKQPRAGEPGQDPSDQSGAPGAQTGEHAVAQGSSGFGGPVGRLSREQAKALLRSLAHDERHFPRTRGDSEDEASASTSSSRNW